MTEQEAKEFLLENRRNILVPMGFGPAKPLMSLPYVDRIIAEEKIIANLMKGKKPAIINDQGEITQP